MINFDFIKNLFGISSDDWGYSNNEITLTESLLNVKFPIILKEYYLQLGKHKKLNFSQDRLFKLEEIEINESGILEFYAENQFATTWGIKINHNTTNPQVYRKEENKWILDSYQLSDFFDSMALL